MDTESVILTVIGADKPGLVERLATIVADHHGNWLESRMARLAGQFAGILQVEVASAHREALVQALNRVHDGSLQVTASRLGASRAETTVTQRVRLELVGTDRPGIVQQISRVIAACRVNVEDRDNGRKCADVWRDAL
jgi:glycine cleavage system regulatory protein